MMPDIAQGLRTLVVGFATTGIVLWLYLAYKQPEMRLISIAPMSWLSNILAFNLMRLCGCMDVEWLNIWSNAVRLHGIILLIGAVVILHEPASEKNRGDDE